MKEIKLTQNKVVMVDDIDFEWLNQWKWYAHNNNGNKFYAERMKDGKVMRMHREIMGLKQGDKEEVDLKIVTKHRYDRLSTVRKMFRNIPTTYTKG